MNFGTAPASVIFTVLSNNTWNGYNTIALTAGVNLSAGPKRTGILHVVNPASHTIQVYSTNIPINNSGANSGLTSLCYYTLSNGNIVVVDKANNPVVCVPPAPAVPDTTPPGITSITAIDAHTIRVIFDEAATATDAGWNPKAGGTPLTITAAAAYGANGVDFTILETMLNSDTLTMGYDSSVGNTLDVALNELVTFTLAAITNSIPAGAAGWVPLNVIDGAVQNMLQVSSILYTGNGGAGYSQQGLAAKYLALANDGGVRFTYTPDFDSSTFGFSDINALASFGAMDFGICVQAGSLYAITNGSLSGIGSCSVGDVLSIEVVGATVTIGKNGSTAYTFGGGASRTTALYVITNLGGAACEIDHPESFNLS